MSHVDLRSMSREFLLEYGNFSCESDNDSSISSCRACVCVCVFVYVKIESRDTSGEYRRKGQGGENRQRILPVNRKNAKRDDAIYNKIMCACECKGGGVSVVCVSARTSSKRSCQCVIGEVGRGDGLCNMALSPLKLSVLTDL